MSKEGGRPPKRRREELDSTEGCAKRGGRNGRGGEGCERKRAKRGAASRYSEADAGERARNRTAAEGEERSDGYCTSPWKTHERTTSAREDGVETHTVTPRENRGKSSKGGEAATAATCAVQARGRPTGAQRRGCRRPHPAPGENRGQCNGKQQAREDPSGRRGPQSGSRDSDETEHAGEGVRQKRGGRRRKRGGRRSPKKESAAQRRRNGRKEGEGRGGGSPSEAGQEPRGRGRGERPSKGGSRGERRREGRGGGGSGCIGRCGG